MFKLIKWTVAGAVLAAVSGFLLFGTHLSSYVATAAHSIREGVHDQIPVEFEIKRAESLIREIEPQIRGAKRDVARAEVELANLEHEVEQLEGDVAADTLRLERYSTALDADAANASFDNASVRNRQLAEYKLKRVFETHKNNVALLDGKRALIGRQQKAVLAARERLDAVRQEKARLEEQIAALKTQKRQLDALQAARHSNEIDLDDTALGKARELLNRVKKRLDVSQRMLESELYMDVDMEAEVPHLEPEEDVVAEVKAYLGTGGNRTAPGPRPLQEAR